jgi:hypothetical protein
MDSTPLTTSIEYRSKINAVYRLLTETKLPDHQITKSIHYNITP